jgi:DNA replication ATP-dependent helicase Dna2
LSETYYARLAALASAPAATPADQLPKLRQLLEKVLRDECKRREAPFADLSQAIGLVAYDFKTCASWPTWCCTKATPARRPK